MKSQYNCNLRKFIEILKSEDELISYDNKVDLKYELGRIARESYSKDNCPKAILFENIADYHDFRILTNGLAGSKKYAMALGEDPNLSSDELVRVFKGKIQEGYDALVVCCDKDSRVTYNGASATMERLPIPWWSPMDAGRYVGTWHLNVTKDPETGTRNVGIYRMQMIDSKRAFISFSPRSDVAKHLEKAEKVDKTLEMAVAIGVNECFIMAGATAINSGKDEYWHTGGLLGGPAQLMRCSSVNLEVPVESEIVLEGHILPHERGTEGPFLDYAGVPKGNPAAAIFELRTITMKHDPIFRGAAVGVKGGEDHQLYSFLARAGVLDFHGSRARHMVQNVILRRRWFNLFQLSGRIGSSIKSLK